MKDSAGHPGHFSAEHKMRDGLRGDDSIAELWRKVGMAQSLYYVWSKEFMEADYS